MRGEGWGLEGGGGGLIQVFSGLDGPGGADVCENFEEPCLGAGGEGREGCAQAGVLLLEDAEVVCVAGVEPAAVAEEPVAGGADVRARAVCESAVMLWTG